MKSRTFNQIETEVNNSIFTGNKLFDEWFSKDGGIVKGTLVLVTGTSGAGKTTLMINLMNWLKDYKSSFYSKEMTIKSIKHQVGGYHFNNPNAFFTDENDCPTLTQYIEELDKLKPDFVIVDSLQSVALDLDLSEDKASTKVREILTKWCKDNNATLFLIGHNTKDGEFAGKNTNMQMVDAHMVMEFDPKLNIRKMYWGKKNRKGPMGELFYTINNGSIEFYKNTEKKDFYLEYGTFIKSYLSSIDDTTENYKQFELECTRLSKSIYKSCNGNNSIYLIEFMPKFYSLLCKYQLN